MWGIYRGRGNDECVTLTEANDESRIFDSSSATMQLRETPEDSGIGQSMDCLGHFHHSRETLQLRRAEKLGGGSFELMRQWNCSNGLGWVVEKLMEHPHLQHGMRGAFSLAGELGPAGLLLSNEHLP